MNTTSTERALTGTYILKARWEQAEASLQRAWDADNRRSTERTQFRVQRAWDKAQEAKHRYERALGAEANDGYHDGYEPGEED
jgi:hypothetical protein